MCNTREENAAELARDAATPEPTPITRGELIDKLADDYAEGQDWAGKIDDVIHGRTGLLEYSNEDLEELGNAWLCDDDGNEIWFKITDPCPIAAKPSLEEINKELLDALIQAQQSLIYLAPEKFDDAEHRTAWDEKLAKIAQVIAKAEGR